MGNVEATFGGAFLHESIFEMAAAYLYGICRNHPFLDGNKRTGVAAALTFLDMNRIEIDADEEEFYRLVIGVAEGRVTKASVAVFLQDHAT
jgi:death-on-curing protein